MNLVKFGSHGVQCSEFFLDLLNCFDLFRVHHKLLGITQDIGSAVNLTHCIVVGLVINKVDDVSLRAEAGFDDLVERRKVAGRH